MREIQIKWICIVCCFLQAANAYAQSDLNLRVGCGLWGAHHHYKFREEGRVLKRGGGTSYYQGSGSLDLRLQYKIRRSYGLEAVFQWSEQDIGMYDRHYFDMYGLDKSEQAKKGEITQSKQELNGYTGAYKNYLSPGLAVYKYFRLGKREEPSAYSRLYVACGMLYNMIGNKKPYTCTFHDRDRNEVLTLQSRFTQHYTSWFADAGLNFSNDELHFYIGLRYGWSGTAMVNADYTHVGSNGLIAGDQVTVKPNYLAFTLSIGPTLKNFGKRRELRAAHKEYIIPDEKGTVVHQDSSRDIPAVQKDTMPGTRKVNVLHQIEVNKDSIHIWIWDRGVADGDKVTLYLNGVAIYSDLELSGVKKELVLNLREGENDLVMFAEDEGRIKPCTAVIIVMVNGEMKMLGMSSGLESSGSIRIIR